MKLLKPIPKSKIPTRSGGGFYRTNVEFYDTIATKVKRLSVNSALPVQCGDRRQMVNTMAALRDRGLSFSVRGLVLYVFKSN